MSVAPTSYRRDPASERFDAAARPLLERAYRNPGRWQATRVAYPDARGLAWCAAHGIDPYGPDNPSSRGGRGLDAKDRWTRAFVRSLFYQHRWFSEIGGRGWREEKRSTPRTAGAIEVEVGRRVSALGVIPAGRAVRVRYAAGGRAKLAAVRRLPDSERIFTDRGGTAERWSDPANRDW